MLNFSSIMLGTTQPEVLAQFYEKVFGKKPDMAEDDMFGWLVGNTFFSINKHSEVNGMAKEPARFMVNFETDQVKEEFGRLKSLGATIVKEPYEMGGAWITTLADPDGNYFQLMTPWKG